MVVSTNASRSVTLAASAVVLAGGASRRMGRDKRLLPWGVDADGRPLTLLQSVIDSLAAVADDVIVVANDQPVVAGARVVPDAIPGAGSLGGILSGVEAARHDRVFVAAADMPFLHAALVRDLLDRLEGHDAVVPVVDGRPEPLHAVYGRAVAPAARSQIERGQLKIAMAFRGLDVLWVPEADLRRLDPRPALVSQRQHAGGLRRRATGRGGGGGGRPSRRR